MDRLPKREKSRLAKLWETFKEMKEIQEKNGFLIPRTAAASLLDVHPTRVDQLCEAGNLVRIDYHGHRYVSENSIVEYARTERKNGRPCTKLEKVGHSPILAWKEAKLLTAK